MVLQCAAIEVLRLAAEVAGEPVRIAIEPTPELPGVRVSVVTSRGPVENLLGFDEFLPARDPNGPLSDSQVAAAVRRLCGRINAARTSLDLLHRSGG